MEISHNKLESSMRSILGNDSPGWADKYALERFLNGKHKKLLALTTAHMTPLYKLDIQNNEIRSGRLIKQLLHLSSLKNKDEKIKQLNEFPDKFITEDENFSEIKNTIIPAVLTIHDTLKKYLSDILKYKKNISE